MSDYIHGETDLHEVERLKRNATFSATFILRDFHLDPGQRILDLACGVGAMTHELAIRFSDIQLFGLDIQRQSLRVAQANHPIAVYTQADGNHLPFGDETFDCVHGSWLLEHVPSPLNILREVRRVLKAGRSCLLTEVDNSSLRTEPEYPEVIEIMNMLNRIQMEKGGDPYIGRRLNQLLREAGFADVDVRPQHLRGDASNPFTFQGMTEIFADIFDSVDHLLGPKMEPKIRVAAARLRGLQSVVGGAIFYSPVVGRGIR